LLEVEQAECKMGVHSQGESGFFDEDTEAQNEYPLQLSEPVVDGETGKSFFVLPVLF
jgi:hypothetical protein